MALFNRKKSSEKKDEASKTPTPKKAEEKKPVSDAKPVKSVAKKPSKPDAKQKDAAKRPNKMSELASRVLITPLVSEKASALQSQNQYAFKVDSRANKIEIKTAISELYGVKPLSVTILNVKPKPKRVGMIKGSTKVWKKAIITLPPGEKLEIYEGA